MALTREPASTLADQRAKGNFCGPGEWHLYAVGE
jgi:hypothetical protein